MKKLTSMLIALVMCLTIAGCSGTSSENASSNSQADSQKSQELEQKKEPLNLTGTWRSEDVNGSYMEATIETDTISVDWLTNNEAQRSIYWVGTYTAPTDDPGDYSWTSTRNVEKTQNALLASRDDTKEFNYKASNKAINYEVSMMGQTRQVALTKVE